MHAELDGSRRYFAVLLISGILHALSARIQRGGYYAIQEEILEKKLEDSKNFPKTLKLEPNFPCYRALENMGAAPGDSVVIAPPLEVDAIMKKVPEGKLITLKEICEKLAKKHKTQYCCTLTTGIFITTAANAAEETKGDTPYWRTLKNNGELNKKYPSGVERQKLLLEKEGHTIIKKGKRLFVKDFENLHACKPSRTPHVRTRFLIEWKRNKKRYSQVTG